jgi:ribosomal protein S18 acetylase RimI-like enzyme
MRTNVAHMPDRHVRVRPATGADLGALLALEQRIFATDRLSRRSLRKMLQSPTADVLVADHEGQLAGTAVVLYRAGATVARLYSIAVDPALAGRGIGQTLLAAAEEAALAHDCLIVRLEVHETNAVAIARYQKSGYRQFGRRKTYYEDGGDALRFQKRIAPRLELRQRAPRHYHQTTDFTCGPACVIMALAWADPSLRPTPAFELQLWREATTIFMTSGPGGCGPFGLATALDRHGLSPEVYINRPGPYFLDTVQVEAKRRVMRLAQAEFREEAKALGIVTHMKAISETALMSAFDGGAVAIVLVSGYHMSPRSEPHWVFAWGRDGRHVLVHDPEAARDKQGDVIGTETYAVPWSVFDRMTRIGRDGLRATIIVRKGHQ